VAKGNAELLNSPRDERQGKASPLPEHSLVRVPIGLPHFVRVLDALHQAHRPKSELKKVRWSRLSLQRHDRRHAGFDVDDDALVASLQLLRALLSYYPTINVAALTPAEGSEDSASAPAESSAHPSESRTAPTLLALPQPNAPYAPPTLKAHVALLPGVLSKVIVHSACSTVVLQAVGAVMQLHHLAGSPSHSLYWEGEKVLPCRQTLQLLPLKHLACSSAAINQLVRLAAASLEEVGPDGAIGQGRDACTCSGPGVGDAQSVRGDVALITEQPVSTGVQTAWRPCSRQVDANNAAAASHRLITHGGADVDLDFRSVGRDVVSEQLNAGPSSIRGASEPAQATAFDVEGSGDRCTVGADVLNVWEALTWAAAFLVHSSTLLADRASSSGAEVHTHARVMAVASPAGLQATQVCARTTVQDAADAFASEVRVPLHLLGESCVFFGSP
jgi:hypothetical protein